MRLITANFSNFRSFRKIEFDFSATGDRHLVVVRAQNESGKTTLLNALRWAFFGKDAFGHWGTKYKLVPEDWAGGATVEVKAEIAFDHSNEVDDPREYKLIREWKLEAPTEPDTREQFLGEELTLMELGAEHGWREVENGAHRLRIMFPKSLKDIFFTDGDANLSFTDAPRTQRRSHVQNAIRQMLNLNTLDKAIGHVNWAEERILRKIADETGDERIIEVTSEVLALNVRLDGDDGLKNQLSVKEQNVQDLTEQIQSLSEREQALLREGNHEQLADRERTLGELMNTLTESRKSISRNFSGLFASEELGVGLMKDSISATMDELATMFSDGQIPNKMIPFLRQRLVDGICVCGASLNEGDPEAAESIRNLRDLVERESSSNVGERDDRLVSMLHDIRHELEKLDDPDRSVGASIRSAIEDHLNNRDSMHVIAAEMASVEEEINRLEEANIREISEILVMKKHERDTEVGEQATLVHEIRQTETSLATKRRELDGLQENRAEQQQLLARRRAIRDIKMVLSDVQDKITGETIEKVSDNMNTYFREIIGDVATHAIIRGVHIDSEHEIVGEGHDGSQLNIALDFNGASRRALTNAFILALTKGSRQFAPNVIDTPLGTQSGDIKQSMFDVLERHSSQLILMLHRDECAGIENRLKERASRIVTMSHSQHYSPDWPHKLVHQPPEGHRDYASAWICECNHMQYCEKCERYDQDKNTDSQLGVLEQRE